MEIRIDNDDRINTTSCLGTSQQIHKTNTNKTNNPVDSSSSSDDDDDNVMATVVGPSTTTTTTTNTMTTIQHQIGRKLTGTILIPKSILKKLKSKKMKTSHHHHDDDQHDHIIKDVTTRPTSAVTENDRNDDDDDCSKNDIINVYMEFVGKETSVVSTPYDEKVQGTYDLHWMKRNRSETRILYRKGIELTSSTKSSSSSFYSSSSSSSSNDDDHDIQQQKQLRSRQKEEKQLKKRKTRDEAITPIANNTSKRRTNTRIRNDNDDDDEIDEEECYHQIPFVLDIPSYLPYTTKYVDTSLLMTKKYRIPHQFEISYKLEAYIPFTSYSISKDIQLIEPKQRLQQKNQKTLLANDENETEFTTMTSSSSSSVDNHNSQRQEEKDCHGENEQKDIVEFHDVTDFYICSSSKPIIRSYLCGLLNVPITTYTLVSSEEPIHFYPNQCADVILHDPRYQLFPKPKPKHEEQHQFPQDLVLSESRSYNSNGTHTTTNTATTTSSTTKPTAPSRTVTVKLCEYVRWKAQTHQKVEMRTWTFTDDSRIDSSGKTKADDCSEINDGDAEDDDCRGKSSGNSDNEYGEIQGKKKDENDNVLITVGSTISADDSTSTSTSQLRQVTINVPADIRSSLKGKLIEISHELIVSVMTHGEHLHVSETVASSKHIPVKIMNYYS